jgi:hypothetical protein
MNSSRIRPALGGSKSGDLPACATTVLMPTVIGRRGDRRSYQGNVDRKKESPADAKPTAVPPPTPTSIDRCSIAPPVVWKEGAGDPDL